MRPNPIKKILREGKPAVGTWLTMGNVLAARFLARAGWDWLTVDTEHNAIGIEADRLDGSTKGRVVVAAAAPDLI